MVNMHGADWQLEYLIDDRLKRGVDEFEGEHIHFGIQNLRIERQS